MGNQGGNAGNDRNAWNHGGNAGNARNDGNAGNKGGNAGNSGGKTKVRVHEYFCNGLFF